MGNQQLRIIHAGCQDVGRRNNQEDAAVISPDSLPPEKGTLAVLCDGMGGMENGEVFSALGTEKMLNYFLNHAPENDMCHELLQCFEEADQAASKLRKGETESSGQEGSSTVVSVLIRDGKCAFLSAGDSRIYLYRGGGMIQLTRDQVLGTCLDERAALGLIPAEDAVRNIRRKALINGLGVEGNVACDRNVIPFRLLPHDKIALMSDGVFGTLDEAEMTQILAQPTKRAAWQLIDSVLKKKKPRQDNCTVLLLEWTDEEEKRSSTSPL